MAFGLFKSDAEKAEDEWRKAYEKGINQKRWDEAAKHFKKAYEHYRKAGDPKAEEALLLFYLSVSFSGNLDALKKAGELAKKFPPNTTFRIPFEIRAEDIAVEAPLLVREIPVRRALSDVDSLISSGDEGKMEAFASRLESISKDLLMNSSRKPLLGEFFGLKEPFEKRGYRYLAYSKLLRAKIQALYDPQQSIELYSEAMGYFKVGNMAQPAEEVTEEMNRVGKVAKCWFCGRTIQGEEIHYVRMPAEVTPYLLSKFRDEKPETVGDGYVIACRACYSAIYITSDSIARRYYQMAMKKLEQVRQELLAEIQRLNARINRLEGRISSLRWEG
ncbi:MAG: hypothetical protein GXO14_04590 [Thermococci archaeon]|nr:hypothetical protein [Thermococci archaeon]